MDFSRILAGDEQCSVAILRSQNKIPLLFQYHSCKIPNRYLVVCDQYYALIWMDGPRMFGVLHRVRFGTNISIVSFIRLMQCLLGLSAMSATVEDPQNCS